MKLLLIALHLLAFTISSQAGAQEVPASTRSTFNATYPDAVNTNWTIAGTLHRAEYFIDDQRQYAFYNISGELVAETRYLKLGQLSYRRQYELIRNFPEHTIIEIFEVRNTDETAFFATLERNGISIVLKSRSASKWKLFEK